MLLFAFLVLTRGEEGLRIEGGGVGMNGTQIFSFCIPRQGGQAGVLSFYSGGSQPF